MTISHGAVTRREEFIHPKGFKAMILGLWPHFLLKFPSSQSKEAARTPADAIAGVLPPTDLMASLTHSNATKPYA